MVVGTGNYTGSAKTSFIIKPEKPVITRLRAHGSKVRITWLPGTSVTGYEIYRSKGAYDYGYKKIAATKMVRCSLIQGQNSPKELIITRSAAMLL